MGTDGLSWPMNIPTDLRTQLLALRSLRVALAAIVGGGLAACGAALQQALKNPLADPYVLGVSGGAGLGATLATAALGVLFTQDGALTVTMGAAAVVGAVAATSVLLWFLWRDNNGATHTALLVGITINAFCWSLVSVLRALLPAAQTSTLSTWLVGAIGAPSARDVVLAAAGTAIGLAGLIALSPRIALLALGDDEATRLGEDVRRVQLWTLLCCSVVVGAAVASAGVIGFLGLIAPHAVRALSGRARGEPRQLIALSAACGAVVLVTIDALARGAFCVVGTELPAGALCALVGAPLFAGTLWRASTRSRPL